MTRGEFVGIDVGGVRKGFHVCALRGEEIVAGPLRRRDVAAVLAWVAERQPRVVALDCPVACAERGRSRPGERELAKEVCGIRWTPTESALVGPYYEWVRHGLRLYRALREDRGKRGPELIEVFPTASWTEWNGLRGGRSRAKWSREGLAKLALRGVPERHNQDDRDAIAAALTARLYKEGRTRDFGGIHVPAGPFG